MGEHTAQSLYDGLAAHRLIIPVGVPGAFGRGATFEEVLRRFDDVVTRAAAADGAEVMLFPPILDRKVLEKSEFLDSFPQLLGSVFSFAGDDAAHKDLSARVHAGQDWNDSQVMTGVVLTPAACYPVYPAFAGTLPPQGRLVDMQNWVFRNEPSLEPTRMQAFRVREFVRLGTPEMVVRWRDLWLERGLSILRTLGLLATPQVASDPFFGRGGRMLAASQRDAKLKFEVQVPIISSEKPTACCSFNYHQDHFGSLFDIKTASGDVAHTACLGFGMERVVMALFATHGFESCCLAGNRARDALAVIVSALDLHAASYRRHEFHGEGQVWVEKNCYVDVWIEVLHALKLDPHPAMAFTLGLDFEGDQWTFFKPPHADLQALYGLEVTELNVYRPLLAHALEHLKAGRLIFSEADSIHLPDTQGTDYGTNHVKTTIVLETVDIQDRRLGYFHNASYHELSGADFEGVFRTAPGDPAVLPLFAELVKIDRVVRRPRDELAGVARGLLAHHLLRRPVDNPFTRFRERVPAEIERLKTEGIEAYHAHAFATTRQVGANFELLAAFLRWLQGGERGNLGEAADRFATLAATAKSLVLKGARAVTSSRPADLDPLLSQMQTDWDEGMALLAPPAI